MGTFPHRDAPGLSIAGNIETDLDLAFDTVTASDFRVLGNYRMQWGSVGIGLAWLQLLLISGVRCRRMQTGY
ncbi:MAG: hypothetical protein OEM50_04835 [Gammaproteobacteria bacterium]|nr:hypothetical protein [Gammaproteobacteria bacterium]MDH3363640.1 hypothetical protein [Gammaproteobacteria bacterium]MDH3481019.1 hypothetical protein [Gammaproteobacteria bacterium]